MEHQPERRPSLLREIGRNAILVDEEYGVGAVSSAVLLAFLAIFLPIGILVFIATGVVFAAFMGIIGAPSGAPAAIAGLAWFGGTLVLLLIVFVRLYRRLPRTLRATVADPAAIVGPKPEPTVRHPEAGIGPTVEAPSLAELDARFAPDPAPDPRNPPA
ncbi:MAG TPA: hypothetical protein VFX65_14365 [Candidatus Limnocylindrales bacterium]|nr:hypothetical protein [Candidatus Limnocylindrales bacterium]